MKGIESFENQGQTQYLLDDQNQMAPMPTTNIANQSQLSKMINPSKEMEQSHFNEVLIPLEERKKAGCCWRLFCPCYYMFCCCLCCEKGMKITKSRFVYRFNKWVNLVSPFFALTISL